MPYPEDPHPVPGSNGVPVYVGIPFLTRRIIGWQCEACNGSGRVKFQRGDARGTRYDGFCPRCRGFGHLPMTFRLTRSAHAP